MVEGKSLHCVLLICAEKLSSQLKMYICSSLRGLLIIGLIARVGVCVRYAAHTAHSQYHRLAFWHVLAFTIYTWLVVICKVMCQKLNCAIVAQIVLQ